MGFFCKNRSISLLQDQGKRIAINGKSNSRALYYIKVSKYNTVDYIGPKMCQFKWKDWDI